MTPPRVRTRAAIDDTRSGAAADISALLARLRREQPARPVIRGYEAFEFPAVGPAVFLRSELTAEAEPPALAFVLRSSR